MLGISSILLAASLRILLFFLKFEEVISYSFEVATPLTSFHNRMIFFGFPFFTNFNFISTRRFIFISIGRAALQRKFPSTTTYFIFIFEFPFRNSLLESFVHPPRFVLCLFIVQDRNKIPTPYSS